MKVSKRALVGTNLVALGVALTLFDCVGDDHATADGGQDSGFDALPIEASTDSASDAGADAAPVPACDLSKPFGTPAALAAPLNGPGDRQSLWFSNDLLTAWFDSDLTADGGTQTLATMFSSSRTSVDAGFSNGIPLGINSVGTGYGVTGAMVTADGLTMYFSNGFTNGYTAWTATRSTTTVDFTAPTELGAPINSDAGTENYPVWISPDGGTLYFASNRAGGPGARDIWTATRAGNGAFTNPAPLANVNTTGGEGAIVLSADELQGYVMRGNATLYYTTRASTQVAFSAPQPVTELNTFIATKNNNGFAPSWLSPDGCTLVFHAGPPEVIYTATRGK